MGRSDAMCDTLVNLQNQTMDEARMDQQSPTGIDTANSGATIAQMTPIVVACVRKKPIQRSVTRLDAPGMTIATTCSRQVMSLEIEYRVVMDFCAGALSQR